MKKLLSFIENNNVDYIIFDVYDTIILRKVHPEYVKKIFSKRLGEVLNLELNYNKIYEIRNLLEAKLCNDNFESGYDLEFNFIEQFIPELYKKLGPKISLEKFREICINLEIEVELAVQYVDPLWIENVKKIKKKGKKIYCLSDFYLPKVMMKRILEAHNIMDFIDEIYISSDYLKTKKSGRIYDVFLDEIRNLPENFLMIGDNEYSDYKMATQKKMKAYLLDRKTQIEFYNNFTKEIAIEKIEKKLKKFVEKNDDEGLKRITLTLYKFIEKLHENLLRDGSKDVFFLSREGEFLKKLFDIYQKKQNYSRINKINSHYLIVSRRSTFLPSLNNIKVETFENLFRQYRKISLFEFLSSLSFELSDMLNIASEIGEDLYIKLEDFPTSFLYKKLLKNNLFIKLYEKNRQEQKSNFLNYINSFNVNLFEENLRIVDVGWKGTIQDNMFNIFDKKLNIIGYYLGLVLPGAMNENNSKKGILFSGIPKKSKFYGVYNENRAIFEILLGASHGSAKRYVEYNKQINVETSEEEKEKELFINKINPLQQEMESYFKKYCEIFCCRDYEQNAFDRVIAEIHSGYSLFPTNKQLQFFNNLYHFENFGVFEFTEFNKELRISFKDKYKNLKSFLKEPKEFLEKGFWGPHTLYKSGLSFLIPIYSKRKYNNIFREENKQ